MDLKLLGKKLRNMRSNAGKSLSEVSSVVGIDKTFLSKVETGDRRPSQSVLDSLLHYYKADIVVRDELYRHARFPHISSHHGILDNLKTEGEGVFKNMNQDVNPPVQQNAQVNVPNNLPILYSDSVWVTASPFGLVFDFGQRMGPTNNVNVVSRVGLSKEHAEALAEVLLGKIKEMQLLTKKTDKKND